MRRVQLPMIVFVLSIILVLYIPSVIKIKKHQTDKMFVLPSRVMRIVSFQFREVASDIAFLNALTYMGGIRTQKGTGRYLPEQYAYIHGVLKNSIALDPYFIDPYNLMNSSLIWDRYKTEEVITQIAKGADTRTWDFQLPYYVGFNYYYFLNDSENSIKYLKIASIRSGNQFYDQLAAQIAYKTNKTEIGIAYLKERIYVMKLEGKELLAESLKPKLETLNGILQIEKAVKSYKQVFKRVPESISELIVKGLLDPVPPEATGGLYYLDPDGNVCFYGDNKKRFYVK